MTVQELITRLQQLDPSASILVLDMGQGGTVEVKDVEDWGGAYYVITPTQENQPETSMTKLTKEAQESVARARASYQGWIVVEEATPGYKPIVLVEWTENGERRREIMNSRGESGCAEAVEWWDKRLGRQCQLESTLRGCYRVK